MKKIILVAAIILFIAGCGGGREAIEIQLNCDDNTNGGNAVVVTVYQLTNADKFRFSSFESLTKKPEETLGTDLIVNSKFEKTMIPGENFKLDKLEIKDGTAFLGIIADFHSPAADGWQQLIPLDKEFDKLVISVHEKSISFNTED